MLGPHWTPAGRRPSRRRDSTDAGPGIGRVARRPKPPLVTCCRRRDCSAVGTISGYGDRAARRLGGLPPSGSALSASSAGVGAGGGQQCSGILVGLPAARRLGGLPPSAHYVGRSAGWRAAVGADGGGSPRGAPQHSFAFRVMKSILRVDNATNGRPVREESIASNRGPRSVRSHISPAAKGGEHVRRYRRIRYDATVRIR